MSKIYVDEIAGIASPSTVAIPGHVIQVQSNVHEDAQINIANGSFTDIVSVSITPTSATNKIYIQASCTAYMTASDTMSFAVFKDGASVKTTGNGWLAYNAHDVSNTHRDAITVVYMDVAGSTNSITYTFKAKNNGSGSAVCASGTPCTITLMEIAG